MKAAAPSAEIRRYRRDAMCCHSCGREGRNRELSLFSTSSRMLLPAPHRRPVREASRPCFFRILSLVPSSLMAHGSWLMASSLPPRPRRTLWGLHPRSALKTGPSAVDKAHGVSQLESCRAFGAGGCHQTEPPANGPPKALPNHSLRSSRPSPHRGQIGRASCRERV